MTKKREDFYVYVYIDPRNNEEFYYGKGRGSRKNAHHLDKSDSEKAQRIRDILREDMRPIIKIIARNLSEHDALLIESTLIWKLGRSITNIASGRFTEKFRPHNKIHLNLDGFDFRQGVYYVNVGEGPHRCWDDCRNFGFLSAGQGRNWSNQLLRLNPGDIVIPYIKRVRGYGPRGYIGIGKVLAAAKRVHDFKFKGRPLSRVALKQPGLFENSHNEKSEYLIQVKWIQALHRDQPKWKSGVGLFTTPLVTASLEKQPKTLRFIESSFDMSLSDIRD